MAANKSVWGIDLGQCALKAIRLRPGAEKDTVDIVDHVYVEHTRILSHPDADRPALIAEAMKKFTEQHDLTKETLVVSVPGQHTLARFTKLPPLENRRKIPELVRFEAQQQIPFDMEEVIWDYQVFEDPKAGEIEVGIFAMRRDLLREQLQYLANLNLEPAIVQSAPLALYNALRFDGICSEEPVCILDIGTQNTDLIVVVEGRSLWTRNIPIGGNAFTEVLLKTFKLSFGKAERLKRDAQKHKYARQIFQAMRPVFADLVAEIQRSIGFFTSSRRGVRLNKIIAMGNAFKLPGMVKFIQQNLGMDVIRPTSFNKLPVAGAANAEHLQDNLLSYGVAYGLALQGLGLSQITSNLVPTEIAKQVVWRRKTPWFYASAAALALAALGVWGRSFADAGAISKGRGDDLPPPSPVVDAQDPQPDPSMLSILNTGFTAQSPMGKARQVEVVSQHLNEVLSKIESKNEPQIAQAKEMISLETNEAVWPHVLWLINQALPKPDPDMAKALAQGPQAVKALIQANPAKYERAKREEIYILTMQSRYSPGVMADFREEGARQGTPGGMNPTPAATPDQSVDANLPGFLIDITLRCPNAGEYEYVNRNFVAKLRAASQPNVAYVGDVRLRRAGQVKDTVDGLGSRTGARGFGAAVGEGLQGEIKSVAAGAVDPVTGELMLDDWMYQGTIAVILGDKPKAPDAAGAGQPGVDPPAGEPGPGPQ